MFPIIENIVTMVTEYYEGIAYCIEEQLSEYTQIMNAIKTRKCHYV